MVANVIQGTGHYLQDTLGQEKAWQIFYFSKIAWPMQSVKAMDILWPIPKNMKTIINSYKVNCFQININYKLKRCIYIWILNISKSVPMRPKYFMTRGQFYLTLYMPSIITSSYAKNLRPYSRIFGHGPPEILMLLWNIIDQRLRHQIPQRPNPNLPTMFYVEGRLVTRTVSYGTATNYIYQFIQLHGVGFTPRS